MAAMPETPSQAKARVREAVAAVPEKGLDFAVGEVEQALVSAWRLERQGRIAPRDVPGLVQLVESYLRKIAPPPPKKVKFSDPLPRILPLSEASVRPALDVAMLLMALTQVGDFIEETDKSRIVHEHFLDDWRRMVFASARLDGWPRFRELATTEELVLEGRLSREATLQVLEAIQKRRTDHITPVPDLSMLACARCGGFRGRDRVRCATCKKTFCTRCAAPTAELCLLDYAGRYAAIDPERRAKLAGDALSVMRAYKLDPHSRNDAFVRALREEGVDVVFIESAPLEGEESESAQSRRKLSMRDRESAGFRRVLIAALARCYFRATGQPADRLLEDYFVDVCAGLTIEEALRTPAG